jgi:hypothetical protein
MEMIDPELHYLQWFKRAADFGPADSDIHEMLDERYELESGNKVPKQWRVEEDD